MDLWTPCNCTTTART